MQFVGKAARITLRDFSSPQMRAFHCAWFAFFLCFFAWFGIAPLMTVVRDELALTKDQVGWCIIGSVAITILSRLFVGWLCDRIGPRLAFRWLLLIGSLPVMGIGLANSIETFFQSRVLIGIIGASFVVTQYHTSNMFAPHYFDTANATAAGWGNLGGGVTDSVVPFINKRAIGSVSGIVGAGGNVGAVAAGFLFKMGNLSWPRALFILGAAVTAVSFVTFAVRFNEDAEWESLPQPVHAGLPGGVDLGGQPA